MQKKEIVYTGKLTAAIFLNTILLAIVTLILLSLTSLLFYLSIVTFAFMIFELMKQTVRFFTYRILITNKSVTMLSGIIKQNKLEFTLAHINGISYQQGYLGRLIGFGNISLVVAGVTQKSINHIRVPKLFCSKLLDALDDLSIVNYQSDGYISLKEQLG